MSQSYSNAPPQLFPLNVPILKTIVFLGPLIIISVFTIVYIYLPDWYLLLVQEDGISEYTQAAAYFLASAFGVATALSLRKTKQKHIFWLIMFTLGTLFMGFEEISWGQRIFGFNTPDIIKVRNIQSEFSVHNLKPVERNTPIVLVSIGLFGGLAWLFNTTKNATDWRRVILPEWYLSLYFISVSAFNVYRWYLLSPETRSLIDREIIGFWRHQEVFELLLALGFLFVAICNYKKLTAPT